MANFIVTTSSQETSGLRGMIRLVLPKEHGSWSVALEPLVLGLIAAPSTAGGVLAASVLAGFFLRRPLKLLRGGGIDPRRPLAWGCVAILSVVAAAGLLGAVACSAPARLWPLLVAMPAGLAFLWFDSRGESRVAAAEMAGVTAFATVPAALGSLAGWTPSVALALAGLMACRSVPTVITIRAYLRRCKGQPAPVGTALAASAAAVIVAIVLAHAGLASWAAVPVMVLLVVRTWFLLGPLKPRLPATTVGRIESVLGVLWVLVVALGEVHLLK
jgi:YwiC-like protein